MQSTSEAIRDYLPSSLRQLATVIRLGSLLILVKNQGGTRIPVPRTAAPEHWLVGLIGLDDFRKLSELYGGEALDMPRCTRLLTLVRDIDILQDSRKHMSYKQMALKHGMTERGIQKALRRIEPQERQVWLKDLQGVLAEYWEGKL